MRWFFDALTSSIGRKVLMALTGLFLILFLTVHLAGNLQLLANDNGTSFNIYSHFMANNPVIQTISWGNFTFILIHVVVALSLSIKNKKARPIGYKVSGGSENSSWASRNMALLGIIIFIFLLVHLNTFWYVFKFGSVPSIIINGIEMHDSYAVVSDAYANIFYSGFYVAAMMVLGFHLVHGFHSAFQSLGLNHSKYSPAIRLVGKLYAVVVSGLFALIPVLLYIKSLG